MRRGLRRKTLAAASLIAIIGLALSACSGNGGSGGKDEDGDAGGRTTNGSTTNGPTTNGSTTNGPGANAADSPGAGADTASGVLKPYEIGIFIPGGTSRDTPQVEAAINAYLKAKINATVKLNYIDWANYQNKTNLMLASGEKFDLFYTANWLGYTNQAVKGELLPLDALIAKYAPAMKDNLAPIYWTGAKVNGKLYGFPTNKEYASNQALIIRKDLMDEYGFDPRTIKSYKDFGSWFKVLKANEKRMVPIVGWNEMESVIRAQFEEINGDYFGVFDWDDHNLKVINMFESPKYMAIIQQGRAWAQAGYFLPDASTTQVSREEYMKNGKAASYFVQAKPGIDKEKSLTSGKDLVQVDFSKPVSGAGDVTGAMLSISQTARDPVRDTMFMNLLYSDKTLLNLIDWGIEGRHYTKISDDIIGFPHGISAANVGYSAQGDQWIFGNQFNSYLFKTEDPHKWETYRAYNEQAVLSKSLGFTFDPTSVQNEIAACNTVLTQYAIGLNSGGLDPDKYVPELNKKLKAAGIDTIIAEKQRQVDAWAAAG